jgi:hypothetical protein
MIDASDAAEHMENTEATDPIEPIDSADPMEPIDNTEPREPIDRSELSDQSDHFEVPDACMPSRARDGDVDHAAGGKRTPGGRILRDDSRQAWSRSDVAHANAQSDKSARACSVGGREANQVGDLTTVHQERRVTRGAAFPIQRSPSERPRQGNAQRFNSRDRGTDPFSRFLPHADSDARLAFGDRRVQVTAGAVRDEHTNRPFARADGHHIPLLWHGACDRG